VYKIIVFTFVGEGLIVLRSQ